MESNPERSRGTRLEAAQRALTQKQLWLLSRGTQHTVMWPNAVRAGSPSFLSGPCCLSTKQHPGFLVGVDTDLRGSFFQTFLPGTYLIAVHISHVFELWNPDSVLLWRLPHDKNPQVSTFTGKKKRKISYLIKINKLWENGKRGTLLPPGDFTISSWWLMFMWLTNIFMLQMLAIQSEKKLRPIEPFLTLDWDWKDRYTRLPWSDFPNVSILCSGSSSLTAAILLKHTITQWNHSWCLPGRVPSK